MLELGCGAGANLAGIAAADPGVRAVGVDLAPTAVEVARATAAAAGLDNVTFDVGDVLALTDGRARRVRLRDRPRPLRVGAGARARGGARRVPQPPRAATGSPTSPTPRTRAATCARCCARWPSGTRAGSQEPLARAERARGLFTLLDRSASPAGPSFYAGVVGEDVHALADGAGLDARPRPARPDLRAGLVHGVRRGDRAPRDGLRRRRARRRAAASRRGRPPSPPSSRRPAGDDRVAREQYFDLLVLRRFRSSLVLPRRPRARAAGRPAAVQRLLVALDGDEAPRGRSARRSTDGAPSRSPTLRERLGVAAEELAEALVAGLRRGGDRVPRGPVAGCGGGGRAPAGERARRSQARPGAVVTTLRNQVVRITDEPTGALLALLDGTRDRAAILEAFPGPLDAAVARRRAGEVRGAGVAARVAGAAGERQRRLGRGGSGVGGRGCAELTLTMRLNSAHPAQTSAAAPRTLSSMRS